MQELSHVFSQCCKKYILLQFSLFCLCKNLGRQKSIYIINALYYQIFIDHTHTVLLKCMGEDVTAPGCLIILTISSSHHVGARKKYTLQLAFLLEFKTHIGVKFIGCMISCLLPNILKVASFSLSCRGSCAR